MIQCKCGHDERDHSAEGVCSREELDRDVIPKPRRYRDQLCSCRGFELVPHRADPPLDTDDLVERERRGIAHRGESS